MKKICMIVPSFTAKGGISSVVNGYKNSILEKTYSIRYIETYCDGNKLKKIVKAIVSYFKFLYVSLFWKPNIVHIHSSFGFSFYRKLPFIYISSLLKIKIINHIHGSAIDELYTNASNRKRKLVVKTYDKCDKIIVLSEEWKKRYSAIFNPNKIFVVENFSVLHEQFLENRKNEKKTILFLGFLSQAKGCYDIPKIIKNTVEIFPNCKFILAGSGEKKDVAYIRNQLNLYGVSNFVEMPGWVKGKQKEFLLENSDIFLLPSYGEAMPMSILEAMGYGMPIISTNVGGIPQLIENGFNGYMVNPGDILGFSSALTKILSSDEILKGMGENSIKIIKEKYSFEIHAKKIQSIYNELIIYKN